MTTHDRAYFDSPEYKKESAEFVSQLPTTKIVKVELTDDGGESWRPAAADEYTAMYEGVGVDRRMISVDTHGREARVELECDVDDLIMISPGA